MTDEVGTSNGTTSALLARSFGWDSDATNKVVPLDAMVEFAAEALLWQGMSHQASSATSMAMLNSFSKSNALSSDTGERLAEVLGLMGAIGEQAGLAWTAVQDAQRLVQTSASRDETHQRLVLRAMAEFAGHFILGVGHSLGNLVLRTLMLNSTAAANLSGLKAYQKANGFPSNSDDRDSWLTISPNMLERIRQAAVQSHNKYMVGLVAAVKDFYESAAFQALDTRRGMDYHRRRPQSVAHTATRAGLIEKTPYGTALAIGLPREDPEANAELVYAVVKNNIPVVMVAMNKIAMLMGDVIRAESIEFTDDARWVVDRQQTLDAYQKMLAAKPRANS